MEFELSGEIINEIVFGMEDQINSFSFDTIEKKLINEKDLKTEEINSCKNENRYISIPEWNSANGFQLMELFITSLHNPIVREELRLILVLRKGVFRAFKDMLKTYPDIEKIWFAFKEREMRLTVIRWYNELRETQGLEKIGEEPEDFIDIIEDDFTFRAYSEEIDKSVFLDLLDAITREIKSEFDDDIGDACIGLAQQVQSLEAGGSTVRLIAETHLQEMAAAITACPFPYGSNRTAVITELFVRRRYRGLGLAKSILEACICLLEERGFRWILFANPLTPVTFIPILLRQGFKLKRSLYILDMLN